MTLQFLGHQPGQPYELSRTEFARFFGMERAVAALRATMEESALALGQSAPFAERQSFWSAIAAFEAAREFNPLVGGCHSGVSMDSHGNMATMRWQYATTSGTRFEAIEPRECSTISAPGYPGSECGDLPAPSFRVIIPADRDQPGRYHYQQLREGGTYCD